jgi:hypothetical protein
LKKIEDEMDLEWPGFGMVMLRQNEAAPGQPANN